VVERVWIDQMIVAEWTLCREDTGYFGTYNCRASLGPATERWRSSGENEEIHFCPIAGVFVLWNHRRVDSSGTVDVQSKCGQQGDPEED